MKIDKGMQAQINMLSYRKKKSIGRQLWKWVRYLEGERFTPGNKPLTIREWSWKGRFKR